MLAIELGSSFYTKIAIYWEYKRLYGKVAKAAENWSQPTKLQSS